VAQVNSLIKQYTEMRRMMQGMFSGGMGGKMMRRMAGMSGMPGMEGGGDPLMAGLPAGLPGSSRKKKKKKKRRR
jgi:signal recognition particle subunit SRP54